MCLHNPSFISVAVFVSRFSVCAHAELVQSTNPDFHKAVVRVNIFRQHRQTIQYISPEDSHKLSHAELVVIDEAAAIPLPLVKKMLGPYLVFMASTINGLVPPKLLTC